MRQIAYITPEMLTWARERIQLSVKELSEITKIKEEKIISWETGGAYPTRNQAKELAKRLRIPFPFLYLTKPPQTYKLPKNKDYRTFNNLPLLKDSIELQYLLSDVYQRRNVMIDLYNEMDIKPIKFTEYLDIDQLTEANIAEKVRNLLAITFEKQSLLKTSNDAFNYYRESISNLGVLVFQADKIDKQLMRGLSIYEEIFPIIVVKRKDEYNARIFTLFHEFTHLLTRTSGICDAIGLMRNSQFDIEIKCNEIAAETLVPEKQLKKDANYISNRDNGWDDELIKKIAKSFAVSREVILGRLASFNDITISFYNKKLSQYTKEYENYIANKSDDGFVPPAINICSLVGKLYASTVIDAYNQNLITPLDVSGYFSNLRLKHFDKVEKWSFS